MKPIVSTTEILYLKMVGKSVDKRWTDWAYNMLVAGFDTENLVILAGEMEPFNQFEMQRLTAKVFEELGLKWNDRELVLANYIYCLVNEAIEGKRKPVNVLDIVKDIYLENDLEPSLRDFAFLYWANNDLIYSTEQWYWPDATRNNIDEMIRKYFLEWKEKYERE